MAGVLAAIAACAGCAGPGLERTAAAAASLTPAATAYVAVPGDVRSGTKDYAGSGRDAAAAVADALSRHLRRVQLAMEPEGDPADLAAARGGGFTYLIRPAILVWEDNDGVWLGGSDRAKILIETVEVASGHAADIAVVEAEADVASQTGAPQTPAEALQGPLLAYARRLIATPAATARR